MSGPGGGASGPRLGRRTRVLQNGGGDLDQTTAIRNFAGQRGNRPNEVNSMVAGIKMTKDLVWCGRPHPRRANHHRTPPYIQCTYILHYIHLTAPLTCYLNLHPRGRDTLLVYQDGAHKNTENDTPSSFA